MHGRVKVKTTAEQQEAKRIEREKKLKLYTAATQQAFDKRKKSEFDEGGLKITGEILSVNPDFYSLWNFRKEIFLHLKDNRKEDEVTKLFEDELNFLESCLRINPKSYGSWNHRCFVMDNMAKPNWKHELELCNLFLQYDERNFHCWDYRRFVVKRSAVPPEQEFMFTTDKISNNFSNYSSWHYRSKLLPLIYPDSNNPVGVQEDTLLEEFETVQNAFFTDPDDQSAWFYHRWLLGRGKKKASVNCVMVSRQQARLLLTTTQPIQVGRSTVITVSEKQKAVAGRWRTVTGDDGTFSSLWIFEVDSSSQPFLPSGPVEIGIEAVGEELQYSDVIQLSADQEENWWIAREDPGTRFRHELSAAASSTLERELESVLELFEVEPDNKWVLMTIVLLMKALDPLKHWADIDSYLLKLQNIDLMRVNYYKDLRSRFVIENFLEEYDYSTRSVSLTGQSLTTLYHPELLTIVVDIDLSDNNFQSIQGFRCMQCARKITLDSNKIADVSELKWIPHLQELSLRNNLLKSSDSLGQLHQCNKLRVLNIRGNDLANQNELHKHIKELIPSLQLLDGEQLS